MNIRAPAACRWGRPRAEGAPRRRPPRTRLRTLLAPLLVLLLGARPAAGMELPELVERSKPAVVGVGTWLPTRRPPSSLTGTGFVVGDGDLVITNAHVVGDGPDSALLENLVVFTGRGRTGRAHRVDLAARDDEHDLVLLRLQGDTRLPTLVLGRDENVREGQRIAFIGFPIGAVLGLYPATHTGIVSAISPIANPARSAGELTPAMIERLANPFNVFQLDATAYPGNSGSPVLDPATGEVVAVINQVYVKGSKENVLKDPSGISYAVPIRHARELLRSLAP